MCLSVWGKSNASHLQVTVKYEPWWCKTISVIDEIKKKPSETCWCFHFMLHHWSSSRFTHSKNKTVFMNFQPSLKESFLSKNWIHSFVSIWAVYAAEPDRLLVLVHPETRNQSWKWLIELQYNAFLFLCFRASLFTAETRAGPDRENSGSFFRYFGSECLGFL